MQELLTLFGNTVGLFGVLVCFVSAVVRLAGAHSLLDHDPLAFFIVGIGLMVAACLAKLHVLTAAREDRPSQF